MRWWKVLALFAAFVLAGGAMHGCVGGSVKKCAELPQESRAELLPARLSETGWDRPDVIAYEPRFSLWTDGATKRRWIHLPPNTQIETRDMNAWRFPVGTKLWKEFTRNGVRVETRLLSKYGSGDGDWAVMAYVWNAEQTDALATPAGLENAKGTPHDVPAARTCMGCHGGTPSRVLGVSAIQLDAETLAALPLSNPPRGEFALPGPPATQAALGYLHANCSHCHNQHRPESSGPRCYDPQRPFDLSLRVDELETPQSTAAYRTALGIPGPRRILDRFAGGSPFKPRMPYLGTKVVDAKGQKLLETWLATVH